MENNLRKLVKNYQKTLKIACGAILIKASAFGALFRFLKHWTTHKYGIDNTVGKIFLFIQYQAQGFKLMPSAVKHGMVTNDVGCNSLIRRDEYLISAVLSSK